VNGILRSDLIGMWMRHAIVGQRLGAPGTGGCRRPCADRRQRYPV